MCAGRNYFIEFESAIPKILKQFCKNFMKICVVEKHQYNFIRILEEVCKETNLGEISGK